MNFTLPTVPKRRIIPTSRRVLTPRTAPTSAVPPAMMTFPRRTPSSASPATTTTTTQPPPLLCSVGSPAAAIHPLYPPDRSCDIVFFTHVRVKNNTVEPVLSKIIFPTFRNVCAAYRDTTCGLSFDVHFLDANQFSATELLDHLAELRSMSRINHYGVLNIYGALAFVESMSGAGNLTDTISAFRSVLGDDRKSHMIVVGVGYFFYNDTNSWQTLTQVVERVASYDVDVVVVITTLLAQPDRRQCLTLPVNAIDSLNPFVPTMEGASHMITAGFSRPSLVVAFALQMGVVYYSLDKEYDLPISASYQACSGFGLADYSQCRTKAPPNDLQVALLCDG
ncbi:uncharacterized protein LOC125947144 [Dermacentor silvarum]|uniref:uncharacterized protein LOC125947144 n=1 Tax=Dermacentor silvarum TaxID=543639 RepID=UPI0021010C46|nr:uncharacterized protein LOC125947144 [Dermacentor silvarum]